MKTLIINGIQYAKYEIEGNRIYIKVLTTKQVKKVTEPYENFIIQIVSMIENKEFTEASYLNV